MSLTTNCGYDYVFELASRLSLAERERLARSITGHNILDPGKKPESFQPESNHDPHSPEDLCEFVLRGPVIEDDQIQFLRDADEEVNRCRPISW